MGKGRKPISNAVKVLKGTDQPCRMRTEVSYERITKIPKAPDYMCKEGKKVYKITAEQLAAKGILDVVNINAVLMYANEMGKYIEAERVLQGEGGKGGGGKGEGGGVSAGGMGEGALAGRVVREVTETKGGGRVIRYVRNPLDKMASEYLANAKAWAVELGITPASSSRVKVGEPEEEDPLKELLNNL